MADDGAKPPPTPRKVTRFAGNPTFIPPSAIASSQDAPQQSSPNRTTRFDREKDFALKMKDDIKNIASNETIDETMAQLQEVFNHFTRGGDELNLVACQKAALCTLRRVVTAWAKYIRIGTTLDGAKISSLDYRYSAVNAVMQPSTAVAKALAKALANAVDPGLEDQETIVHTQRRIDSVTLAAKKQWFLWQSEMVAAGSFGEYETSDQALSDDEAQPITYTMQPGPATLNPPSTPASLLYASADDENELHDNVNIYVSGKVLKTKHEKNKDALLVRLEGAQAAKKNATGTLAKTTAPNMAAVQPDSHNSAILSAPPQDPSPTESNRSLSAALNGVPTFIKKPHSAEFYRRAVALEGHDPRTAPPLHMAQRPKQGENAGARAVRTIKQPVTNVDDNLASEASVPSMAPLKTKPGGGADKWLRDEDDWGHNYIVRNPGDSMPMVYRALNARFANTAYRAPGEDTHSYRSDWVEYPHPQPLRNKATRDFDIFHRSYQSVRQHFENFKKEVNDDEQLPPYTWKTCPDNLAVHIAPRVPPPRPDLFRDGTPIPRVTTAAAPSLTHTSAPAPAPLSSLGRPNNLHAPPRARSKGNMHAPPRTRAKETGSTILMTPAGARQLDGTPLPDSRVFTAPFVPAPAPAAPRATATYRGEKVRVR